MMLKSVRYTGKYSPKKLKIAVASEVAHCNLVAACRDTFCLHLLCRTQTSYTYLES